MSSGGISEHSLPHEHDSLGIYDWTFDDHKAFEVALASNFDKADRWERTAACVSNTTAHDIHSYFLQLEDDVRRIDMGLVPIPAYEDLGSAAQPSSHQQQLPRQEQNTRASVLIDMPLQGPPMPPPQPSPKKVKTEGTSTGPVVNTQADKRKGVPWTEEEHKLFLLGLAKFGKGDWRSIARNYVVSRTPTQVASHAQKYFIRLNSSNNKKEKRRSSIHDITSESLRHQSATPSGLHHSADQMDMDN